VARRLEEFIEENSGDEGPLVNAMDEKGKVTKAGVKEQLKAIKNEEDCDEERKAFTRCLELIEAESEAGRTVKDAQLELDKQVLTKYGKLSEAEIKTLLIEDKWFASIHRAIDGEVQRLTYHLAGRVKELEERYAQPLAALRSAVETLGDKVAGHLKNMGVALA